jgi:hypothetical protein
VKIALPLTGQWKMGLAVVAERVLAAEEDSGMAVAEAAGEAGLVAQSHQRSVEEAEEGEPALVDRRRMGSP